MWIKFLNKEPQLVGAKHYRAPAVADFHEAIAMRLVRGKIAEKTMQPTSPQSPVNPRPSGQPETATIKTELETP